MNPEYIGFEVIGNSILYEYQKPHAIKLALALDQKRVAIDISGTGTGKTYSALAIAKQLNYSIFVVCPKNAIYNWERSALLWGVPVLGIVNYELIRIGRYYQKQIIQTKKQKEKIKIIKTECPFYKKSLRNWELPQNSLLIFDEVHRCKNFNSQNAEMLRAVNIKTTRLLMLSATIAEGSIKMMSIAFVLGLYQDEHGCHKWAEDYGARWCPVSQNVWGWKDCSKQEDMIHLHNLLSGIMDGMKTDELRKSGVFPQTHIIAEPLTLDTEKEIAKLYDEIKEKIALLNEKQEEFEIRAQHLQILQKELQQIELLKISTMVDMANDFIEENYSVVIFCNYVDTLKEFCHQLNTTCTISGLNKSCENEANRLLFENNTSRIIICNMASAQESIDLQDKYHTFPRVSLITPNFNPQILKQVLGRIDRATGTDTIQYIIFSAGTPEEKMANVVKSRIQKIEAFNSGNYEMSLF
jgi:superfamily II DNA or RNA helicase